MYSITIIAVLNARPLTDFFLPVRLTAMTQIRTRFAPSPTGYLHIGGARTALFNYLFARHHGGKFILRIEDTDRERSTHEAIEAILEAMDWLKLDYDEGPFYQTDRFPLYKEKIQQLLATGKAYPCVCTPQDLDAKRQLAQKEKRKPSYDGTCRPVEGVVPRLPEDKPYTIRFGSPQLGTTVVNDLVKGNVIFDNRELDDLIIARTDGTPTYNFCVVVDDIEMKITHVIRGDDHLANTPRQIQLYHAMGHTLPQQTSWSNFRNGLSRYGLSPGRGRQLSSSVRLVAWR
jgi:glutamyl-tRNA synthetase